jgi:hypothetical protein
MNIGDGDSGSWVIRDHKLCGYIFSRIQGQPWAYMLPIETVFEDISKVLSTDTHLRVRIPTAAEISQKRELALKMEKLVKSTGALALAKESPDTCTEDHTLREDMVLPVSRDTSSIVIPTNTPPSSRPAIAQGHQLSPIAEKSNSRRRITTGIGGTSNFHDAEDRPAVSAVANFHGDVQTGDRTLVQSDNYNREVSDDAESISVRSEQICLQQRDLGVFDVAALIINKQISTGIFTMPGLVLSLTGSKTISIVMWFCGGIWAFLRYVKQSDITIIISQSCLV